MLDWPYCVSPLDVSTGHDDVRLLKSHYNSCNLLLTEQITPSPVVPSTRPNSINLVDISAHVTQDSKFLFDNIYQILPSEPNIAAKHSDRRSQ